MLSKRFLSSSFCRPVAVNWPDRKRKLWHISNNMNSILILQSPINNVASYIISLAWKISFKIYLAINEWGWVGYEELCRSRRVLSSFGLGARCFSLGLFKHFCYTFLHILVTIISLLIFSHTFLAGSLYKFSAFPSCILRLIMILNEWPKYYVYLF